jgi:PIN domain nuclease of toxin-antitoxin system
LDAGYELLDISENDLITSYQLPGNRYHRDPFDRFLVWQCIRNNLIFVTADGRVKEYVKAGLKLVT